MLRIVGVLLLLLATGGLQAAETVLVTAVQGGVTVEGIGEGKKALEAFVRLKEGDRLNLSAKSQAKLVYVGKGRQEIWLGAGAVVIGAEEGKVLAGSPQLQVLNIPPEVARQLNRTPSPGSDGRVGMMRMRSMPPLDAVTRLEQEYAELRGKTSAGDILPEVYLLAGLYDLRQYERLEGELQRIESSYRQDPALPSLLRLYRQALDSVRSPDKAKTE